MDLLWSVWARHNLGFWLAQFGKFRRHICWVVLEKHEKRSWKVRLVKRSEIYWILEKQSERRSWSVLECRLNFLRKLSKRRAWWLWLLCLAERREQVWWRVVRWQKSRDRQIYVEIRTVCLYRLVLVKHDARKRNYYLRRRQCLRRWIWIQQKRRIR